MKKRLIIFTSPLSIKFIPKRTSENISWVIYFLEMLHYKSKCFQQISDESFRNSSLNISRKNVLISPLKFKLLRSHPLRTRRQKEKKNLHHDT